LDKRVFYEKKYGSFSSLPGFYQEREYCGRIIKWMKHNNFWPEKDDRYLDAGCGFGLKTYLFSDHFKHSQGIDFSEKVVDICKLLNDKPEHLDFEVHDIESFSGKSYDLVTAFGLSHLNLDDPEELSSRIKEIADRFLNRKGVLLITTRKGPANTRDTGWYNHTGEQIIRLKKHLSKILQGYTVYVEAPDEKLNYQISGNLLQLAGSLRKALFNKPRDLFIIIKNG
jgi:SAM-dependent methyltransferase